MMKRTVAAPGLVAILTGLVALMAPPVERCHADDPQLLTVSYVLAPARGLPEHLQNVAVIDAGVESDEERSSVREQKWQDIAADMIEAMIQSGESGNGADGLRVVDRRSTKQILAEKDMQLVGIVEGDAATAAGKLLAVDGLIMSRVKIHIDYKRSRKQEVDWISILGGGGGGRGAAPPPRYRRGYHRGPNNPYRRGPMPPPRHRGGPDMPTRTIEEISRDLTVQCSFTLVDVRTGEALVRHTPPVYQKRDKARPKFMFGQRVDDAQLDPVDHFIGELVERAAREFVGMVSPVAVTYTYPVELRRDAEPAIRMLRADDYRGALDVLTRAYEERPKDTDNLFAMGLIHEIMGNPQKALSVYREVVSLRKVDKDKIDMYLSAKDRLTAHLERIIPGPPGQRYGGLVTERGESGDDFRGSGDRKRDKNRDDDDDDD